MKAILEFNLPEDQSDFQLANSAYKLLSIIKEMRALFRGVEKNSCIYGRKVTELQCEEIELFEKAFFDIIEESGVNLEDFD